MKEDIYLVAINQVHKGFLHGNLWRFKCGTRAPYNAHRIAKNDEVIEISPRKLCSNCFTFLRKYRVKVSADEGWIPS